MTIGQLTSSALLLTRLCAAENFCRTELDVRQSRILSTWRDRPSRKTFFSVLQSFLSFFKECWDWQTLIIVEQIKTEWWSNNRTEQQKTNAWRWVNDLKLTRCKDYTKRYSLRFVSIVRPWLKIDRNSNRRLHKRKSSRFCFTRRNFSKAKSTFFIVSISFILVEPINKKLSFIVHFLNPLLTGWTVVVYLSLVDN